jgi:hypothetical protein
MTLSPKKKAKISESSSEDSEFITQDNKRYEDTLPTFIYSYKHTSNLLHRTDLVTGEQSRHQVPSYRFKPGSCWTEVPGIGLMFTGGGRRPTREAVRIDTRREFAVSLCHPMLTPRKEHAAVYTTQHLYVLGGYNGSSCISECERYVCAENRWEALPPLPTACRLMSGVVVEKSLFALGGLHDGRTLDLVQRLSLERLTWDPMQLRLPFEDFVLPCFKLRDTEAYLVIKKALFSLTALEVRQIKTLTEDISSWYGASYYSRGRLYSSNGYGAVRMQEIGSLCS